MKFVTEKINGKPQTINNQGKEIVVNGQRKAVIFTASNKEIWAPAEAITEGCNTVTYKQHEAGDTFIATRDSSRVWEEGMKGYTEEKKGNPLYLKGDKVTRTESFPEFVSVTKEEVFTEATKEKMRFAKELGLSVTI